MSLKEALHDYLRDTVNVSVSDGRLPTRPMMPHLVQHYVSGSTLQTHSRPASLFPRRVQIDAYADNSSEADDLATRIINALDGFHGMMGGTIAIGWIALVNQLDAAPIEMKNSTPRWRSILDFEVAHQRLEVGS